MKKDEFKLEQDDYYSILLVQPFGKKTLQFRLSRLVLIGLGIGLIAIFTGLGTASYLLSKAHMDQNEYISLKEKTKTQEQKLQTLDQDIEAIQNSLKSLIQKEENISRLLQKKKKRSRKRRNATLFDKNLKVISEQKIPSSNPSPKLQKAEEIVNYLKDETLKQEGNYAKLTHNLKQLKKKFASTPSLWPTYGYVKSQYGWRTHPVTGRRQFHKGIDIPSWVGAPVKSTADGVIEFAGWGGGYGWLIIVAHDYGYSTVYAHLSDLLVTTGRHVKKGEIIGKIGKTGLTTGPHIHYEVRRWRRPLNPNRYMGLDLYTAVTKLW